MARSFPINFGHRGASAQIVRALENSQIRDALRPRLWYRQVVQFGDFVGEADTDQLLTLNPRWHDGRKPDPAGGHELDSARDPRGRRGR